MTLRSAGFAGSADTNPEYRAQAGTRPFMLTLCRLAAPVSLRPPQSPQLKSFTFFTSRTRQPDGSEQLYLHMGYFESLSDAEKWAQIARVRYPHAIATIAPASSLRPPDSMSASSQPADDRPALAQRSDQTPLEDQSLTDTQILKMLETRRGASAQDGVDASTCEQIGLLRPDDTSTRRALKEAVARGSPVFFAVQLDWSAQPIDLSRVPSLAILRAYALYAIESRREGRSRYFLRLGFFGDPISAKQVAVQVRSKYAAAAVVPVLEQEVTRVREAGTGASIPYLEEQRVDQGLDSNGMPGSQEAKPVVRQPRKPPRSAETLEQTLRRLAAREIWTDPDSLSESGVRHLKVEIQEQEQTPARSQRL